MLKVGSWTSQTLLVFDELKCFWKPDVFALMGLLINDLVRAPKGAVTVQTPGTFQGVVFDLQLMLLSPGTPWSLSLCLLEVSSGSCCPPTRALNRQDVFICDRS